MKREQRIADTNETDFFTLPNQSNRHRSRRFVLRKLRGLLADAKRNEILDRGHTGTITLGQFFTRPKKPPTEALKYTPDFVKRTFMLSLVLLKAFNRSYKTSMMPRPWTEDTIEFIFEHNPVNGLRTILHSSPMISAPADTENDITALTSRFDGQSLEDQNCPKSKRSGSCFCRSGLRCPWQS